MGWYSLIAFACVNAMRLTIFHRHFWPADLPYANMLRVLAEGLAVNGHQVTVVAPVQDDGDLARRLQWSHQHGIEIVHTTLDAARSRSPIVKILLYFRYLVWAAFRIVRTRPDVVWVATTPPVLACALVRLLSRLSGFRYVYHCQDIHPEVAAATRSGKHGWRYRYLAKLDRDNVNSAAAVIVLSTDMEQTLRARGCSKPRIYVINNFLRQDMVAAGERVGRDDETCDHEQSGSSRQRWIFAGNIGYFQNLEMLVSAFGLIEPNQRPDLTLLGGGVLRSELKKLANKLSIPEIRFLDPVDSSEAQEILRSYDVGVVSLSPGIINYAYPSKMVNYLAAGLKIFAIVDDNSDMSEFLHGENLGATASVESAEALAVEILNASRSRLLEPERARCQAVVKREFSEATVVRRYESVLLQVVAH